MAQIIDFIKESIAPQFIPVDQQHMEESICVKGVATKMVCEICPKKRNQDYLLAKFDIKDNNQTLFPYFRNNTEGLLCMCDYIVFVEEPSRFTIVAVELKHHNDSPEKQIYINIPFSRFIIERLSEIDNDLFQNVIIQYRGIGVKASYRSRSLTQGYKLVYNKKLYALLPNAEKMHLSLVCDGEVPGDA